MKIKRFVWNLLFDARSYKKVQGGSEGKMLQEIQSKNTNPRTLFLCLDLGKTPDLM